MLENTTTHATTTTPESARPSVERMHTDLVMYLPKLMRDCTRAWVDLIESDHEHTLQLLQMRDIASRAVQEEHKSVRETAEKFIRELEANLEDLHDRYDELLHIMGKCQLLMTSVALSANAISSGEGLSDEQVFIMTEDWDSVINRVMYTLWLDEIVNRPLDIVALYEPTSRVKDAYPNPFSRLDTELEKLEKGGE